MKTDSWKPSERLGFALLILACIVFFLEAMVSMDGCAWPKAGPSKTRYAELLHECREANREHLRIIREYQNMDCRTNPDQQFGAVEHGLGGY